MREAKSKHKKKKTNSSGSSSSSPSSDSGSDGEVVGEEISEVQVLEFLELHGKKDMDKKEDKIKDMLAVESLQSVEDWGLKSATSKAQVKQLKECMDNEVRAWKNAVIALQWKMKKRTSVPKKVMQYLEAWRVKVDGVFDVCSAFQLLPFDVDKGRRALDKWPEEWALPPRLSVQMYREKGKEHITFSKWDELLEFMSHEDEFPTNIPNPASQRDNQNMDLIEYALVRLWEAPGNEKDPQELEENAVHCYEFSTRIVETVNPPIPREHVAELQVVQQYFDTQNIAGNYNDVKEKVDKASSEAQSTGLLKTFTASSSFASFSARREKLYEKHGKFDFGKKHMLGAIKVALELKDGLREFESQGMEVGSFNIVTAENEKVSNLFSLFIDSLQKPVTDDKNVQETKEKKHKLLESLLPVALPVRTYTPRSE